MSSDEFLSALKTISEKSLDSLLEPLAGSAGSNRTVSVFAKQEVVINNIAKFEIKSKLFATSHCLYVWMLAKCQQCMMIAKTKDEEEIICTKARRLMEILEILEKLLRTAPRNSEKTELFFGTENGDLLTSSVSDFIKLAITRNAQPAEEKMQGNQSTEPGNPEEEKRNDKPQDASATKKQDEDVLRFAPALKGLVKNLNPHSRHFDEGFASWENINGYENVKADIYENYVLPRMKKRVDPNLKMCLMLYGPPGTGKTMIAEAIATQLQWNLMCVSQVDFSSSMSGQNLQKLKAIFIAACEAAPVILLFDEMEVMFPDRANVRNEHKHEEIGQLLVLFNDLKKFNAQNPSRQVLVLGATNIPKKVDPATWRRMEYWIHIPLPTNETKRLMVEAFLGTHVINGTFSELDWKTFLLHTRGFASSDMNLLLREIASIQTKILEKATHFRPLLGFNPEEKKSTNISHWTPCSSSHPEAIQRTHEMIPKEEIILPDLSVAKELIIQAAINRPPSLNIDDPEGPVAICEEFAKKYGNASKVSIDPVGVFDLKPFDSEAAYRDAKHSVKQQNEAAAAASSDCTVPCREISMVTNRNGKWCPVGEEPVIADGYARRPLPPLPDENKVEKKKKTKSDAFIDKLLYFKNMLE